MNVRRLWLGAVALVLVGAVSLVAADPCVFDYHSVFLPSSALACFQQVQLPAAAKQSTIDTLRTMISMYAFADISANSGAPFYIRTDLQRELNRIAAASYAMDYDFHEDLRSVFASLGDAHTTYTAPYSYRNFAVLFPWLPSAQLVPGGTNGLGVFAGNVSTLYGSPYPWLGSGPAIDLSAYAGLQIATVNGVDAVLWAQSVGDNVGYSRSRSTRFNFAFLVGLPAMTVGRTANLPRTDNWVVTFTNGQSVTVPIVTTCLAAFENTSQFKSLIGYYDVTDSSNEMTTTTVTRGLPEDHEAHPLNYGTSH